jgi:hypothetical protein
MNNIHNRIEEVINSLENIRRASPGPFFFERLQNRLRCEKLNLSERKEYFFSRPIIAGLALLIVFLIDGTAIKFSFSIYRNIDNQIEDSFSEEYGMTTNDFYGIEVNDAGDSSENR